MLFMKVLIVVRLNWMLFWFLSTSFALWNVRFQFFNVILQKIIFCLPIFGFRLLTSIFEIGMNWTVWLVCNCQSNSGKSVPFIRFLIWKSWFENCCYSVWMKFFELKEVIFLICMTLNKLFTWRYFAKNWSPTYLNQLNSVCFDSFRT